MKLDEAVMRMRELERTLAKTAAEHATVAQRCGVLQDTVRGTAGGAGSNETTYIDLGTAHCPHVSQVDRLRMAGEETRRRHEAETSWYTPRIKEVTHTERA